MQASTGQPEPPDVMKLAEMAQITVTEEQVSRCKMAAIYSSRITQIGNADVHQLNAFHRERFVTGQAPAEAPNRPEVSSVLPVQAQSWQGQIEGIVGW